MATSTSLEMLTPDTDELHQDSNNVVEPEVPERQDDAVSKLVDGYHAVIQDFQRKYKTPIKIAKYVVLNVLVILYFAYATLYFLEQRRRQMDFCNGYGMVVLLMAFGYLLAFYSCIYKPLLAKRVEVAWTPVREAVRRAFGHTAAQWSAYLVVLLAILAFLVWDSWESPNRLIALGGFFALLLFGWLFSKHPGRVRARPVICGLLVQFALGLFTIRWDVGRSIFQCAGDKATVFLQYTNVGSEFVYGSDLISRQHVFAFEAMSVIFFLSFMVHILYYYGLVQKVVMALGVLLQDLIGTTICESVNAAANIFLGMTESPILLLPYLQDLTTSEVHAVMAGGFAAVSGTVLAAYINFGASASHLITASVMSAPAALCFAKLYYPETEETRSTKETIVLPKREETSVLDAACKGASMGVEIVLGIIANVIAFVTFVAFLNGVVGWLGLQLGYDSWSIEELLSYVFMPLSFLMGVPWKECKHVGQLIGIKTIVNEFSAYQMLGNMKKDGLLSPRSEAIATYAVCGFSNPGSVGIMISTMSTLMPGKRAIITELVFRAFVAGAVVCFMTACIAGMLMGDENL